MNNFKFTLLTKTTLGKWAVILSLIFIVLISLKIGFGIRLPTFAIAGLGMAGFVAAIIALIKKDRAVSVIIPILAGLVIILWTAAELIYPH